MVWSQRCEQQKTRRQAPGMSVQPPWAAFYSRSLPNGYARSSFFKNPEFVTNRTSELVGRPGPSEDSLTNQGSTNIRRV